jgi:hypothetical protein
VIGGDVQLLQRVGDVLENKGAPMRRRSRV